MKKNKAEECELVEFRLSKDRHPIAFENKVKELVSQGISREKAEEYLDGVILDMEVYYEEGQGFFLVECDAVECVPIYSPYSKEELVEVEEK